MNTFSISRKCTSFNFHNKDESSNGDFRFQFKHYRVFHRVMNYMRTRGFVIEKDETVSKIIRRDYYSGQKGELKFKAHKYPAGFSIKFYQDINYENPAGGYYDFDKYLKMPYMIKLLFRNEVKYIALFLESLGYKNNTDPEYIYAKDKIKKAYFDSWHKEQKSMNFSLSDTDGFSPEYDYNHLDRDKKQLFNGQIKYFRHWDGRIYRGTIYHNINNMWWVIINKYEYHNIADFKLFDLTKADLKERRLTRKKIPKEYQVKRESLSKSKNKELINELRRRGLKVCV